MHCGSDGHKTRVDVDGGCLAFALSVMNVQASTMWGLPGVRSLGLHSGSVIAYGGEGTGKGRHVMEREIQGRERGGTFSSDRYDHPCHPGSSGENTASSSHQKLREAPGGIQVSFRKISSCHY